VGKERELSDSLKKASQLISRDEGPVRFWLSTGCTVLDLAIANRLPGGFPGGRISHIYGEEATAKTVLLMEPLGAVQRLGGKAYFEDAEQTFDARWATLFGITTDGDNWEYRVPESIEEFFDTHIAEILSLRSPDDSPGVVGLDSLSALPSTVEVKEKLEDATYGTSRARQLSTAFRKYISPLNRKNLSVIFVDQARVDVGVVFGQKLTTSGGKALRFYASTRVRVDVKEPIKNARDRDVGVVIRFKVEKNKVAPPFRTGDFRLLWDYGIDDTGTNLCFLRENLPTEIAPDKESGAPGVRRKQWVFRDRRFRSLDEGTTYIEDNNLEKVLQEEVHRVWKELYAPVVRKLKVR